jgi:hypothetical protein
MEPAELAGNVGSCSRLSNETRLFLAGRCPLARRPYLTATNLLPTARTHRCPPPPARSGLSWATDLCSLEDGERCRHPRRMLDANRDLTLVHASFSACSVPAWINDTERFQVISLFVGHSPHPRCAGGSARTTPGALTFACALSLCVCCGRWASTASFQSRARTARERASLRPRRTASGCLFSWTTAFLMSNFTRMSHPRTHVSVRPHICIRECVHVHEHARMQFGAPRGGDVWEHTPRAAGKASDLLHARLHPPPDDNPLNPEHPTPPHRQPPKQGTSSHMRMAGGDGDTLPVVLRVCSTGPCVILCKEPRMTPDLKGS